MKKIISIILSAIMALSVLAVCAVSVSAAETGAGNWTVMLGAAEEEALLEGEDVYISTPGYKYTDNGFEIVPPTYVNTQARFTAISKTKYDATNFSAKIQIDEFDASGDAWISFTFWSELNGLAQGSNSDGAYGYGWSCLIRDCENFGSSDGAFSRFEGFGCGKKARPGGWNNISNHDFTPNVVDGKQIIELKVVDECIYINGVAVFGGNYKAIRDAFMSDQGLAYFGITVKSGRKDAPVKFTILEINGNKPTGTDSAEPINRGKTYAPIKDASEIDANTPGVLFDGTLRAQNSKLPVTSQCTATITENGTFMINPASASSCVTFDVNADYSVDIKDFPYIGIILKNYCTCPREDGVPLSEACVGSESIGLFYYAGDIIGVDLDHRVAIGSEHMVDITPEGSEDYYVMMYAQLNVDEFEDMESRLHGVRVDFGNLADSFEIVYLGFFNSPDDMVGYTSAREDGFIISTEDIDLEFDGADSGLVDDDDGEDEYPDDLEDEDTTTKNSASVSVSTSASTGCGSFIGMGSVVITMLVSVFGFVSSKKKK